MSRGRGKHRSLRPFAGAKIHPKLQGDNMPTDPVKNRCFAEMLSGNVRFIIPFFQRGYTWKKRNWEQLFLDIKEQIIDELAEGADICDVEHFFGPIVVMEQPGSPDLKEFLVIDGQQRITTVYLLLGLIRQLLGMKKHLSGDASQYIEGLKKFVMNDVEGPDDYFKLKVFSSKGDRLPTYRMVLDLKDANPTTPLLQADVQMYVPGKNGVDAFQEYALRKIKADYRNVPSLYQLAIAVLTCLKVVWIPLDNTKDDAQAIFESLNDKGTPLTASELLCNYLFRPIMADANAPEAENLHNNYWLAAIRLLGDDEHFEEYLRHLFSIGETKMVGKLRKVYIHFKGKNPNLTSQAAKQQLALIFESAPLYRTISDPLSHPYKHEGVNRLLIDIANTRMESSRPLVLSLLRAHTAGTVGDDTAIAILRETLVLLVRRKMALLSTTKYDKMFPSLLGKIINEPNPVKALHEAFKSNSVWVSDQEFGEAVATKPVYRQNDLAFSRMVLIEIDRRFQLHGQFPDYSTVGTIEHVIPQTRDQRWSAYLGTEANDGDLPSLVDTIGNLCLLSGPANSAAGQDPFEAKKTGYSPLTALARQIKDHDGRWNLNAVRQRSERLAKEAVHVWAWAND
jgi:hypothetical protein